MPCWMGVDLGEKRIGIAVSDPDGILALPREVATIRSPAEALACVARHARAARAAGIVIGLPLNMDGSRGPAAQKAEQFARALEAEMGLPVRLWDERLTTKTAHDAMIEAGTRGERRRGVVDKLAAQIMLQGFLDAHGAPPPGAP